MTSGGNRETKPNVLVEVVEVDQMGLRQIAPTERLTAQLTERRSEIEGAVALAAEIVQSSVVDTEEKKGFQVREIEAKFGITLTAEAGVILSKVGAEATFEVTIKVSRDI
jgi:hypothetical protein